MNDFNISKNYLLQITNELYRITLLFPKKEPLRYKMRELGNEILANFVDLSKEEDRMRKISLAEQSSKQIEVLEGFLDVARSQNWVRISDLLSLQEEYDDLKDNLLSVNNNLKKKKKQKVVKASTPKVQKTQKVQKEPEPQEEISLSERQKKILKILKKKERAQVHEMKNYFPDTSKRTIRRDLKELLENALIKRKGQRSNTFYEMKSA